MINAARVKPKQRNKNEAKVENCWTREMQNTSPVKSSEDDLGGGLWWEGFAIDDSLTN